MYGRRLLWPGVWRRGGVRRRRPWLRTEAPRAPRTFGGWLREAVGPRGGGVQGYGRRLGGGGRACGRSFERSGEPWGAPAVSRGPAGEPGVTASAGGGFGGRRGAEPPGKQALVRA